jgi:methyl-accepting chemotaxis protein
LQRQEQESDKMSAVAASLNIALHEVSQFFTQTRGSVEELRNVAKNLSDAGLGLRQSVESDVTAAQRTMHEVAVSFATSAKQLSNILQQGLGPATRQVANLHETLVGLEQVVESIGRISHARADIDRVSDALARAAEISDAILSLPEQIREILEENSRHDAVLADSGASWRSWISKWPK